MTTIAVILLAAMSVVGLVFALPCQACRKRRERMQAAYAAWHAKQAGK